MNKSTTSFREMQLDAIKGRILSLFEHKKKEALLKKQKPPTRWTAWNTPFGTICATARLIRRIL